MPNVKLLGAIALSALLLGTGCKSKTAPADTAAASTGAPETNAAANGSEAPPPVVNENAGAETAPETDTTPVKNLIEARKAPQAGGVVRYGATAPAKTAAAPARPAGQLARYVNLHPREIEDGRSFLGEPAVRKAVAGVRDARVRDFILHYDGPDAPIAGKNGRIIAWGCEAHNCGFHNWTVAIRSDGSSAEICYYRDDERPDGTATWYLPGGRTEKRAGNCPDE